jgi:hypothetical protein
MANVAQQLIRTARALNHNIFDPNFQKTEKSLKVVEWYNREQKL